MSDTKQIWLAPICHEDGGGRQWGQDDVLGGDCGCGIAEHQSVRYVLAADYDRLEQECERLRGECEGCPMSIAEDMRIQRDAALKQVEGLRALLADCRQVVFANNTSLWTAKLLGNIETALQAKP